MDFSRAEPRFVVANWLRELSQVHSGRCALEAAASGERLSFEELCSGSERVAASLSALGLVRNDAIAIWLPNRPLWLLIHFAAVRLGLFTVPLNTWYRGSEFAHFAKLSCCKAVFIDSSFRDIDFAGIVRAASGQAGLEGLRWLIECAQDVGAHAIPGVTSLTLAELGSPVDHGLVTTAEENTKAIAFATSGTTSAPKLAVHRESVLLAHATAVALQARLSPGDIVLAALPPCGAYGYTLLLSALSAGARVVMLDEFDLDALVKAVIKHRITVLALTEPIMRALLDHPSADRRAFSSLRLAFSAGATLRPVVERAEQEFGFRITNVYGSSEVLALAAFWDIDRGSAERSAAGGVLTHPDMRVRAVDGSGNLSAPGQEGELQFSGPILATGYWGNESATTDAFQRDGWFRSGDLGSVGHPQDREFYFTARLNDALRVKGFLVSPAEIEALLLCHPGVAAVQVVGIPDGLGENLAVAFVILEKGNEISAEELRAFCRARMASYKSPALIEFVSSFPMTRSANGDKVMKNRLRDIALTLRVS